MKLHLLGLTVLAALVGAIPSYTNSTFQKRATPKLVFAHFMVDYSWIVDGYTQADWANDIALARPLVLTHSHLDRSSTGSCYAAARSTSFKLFISFDFAASPGFSDFNNQIVPRLKLYASNPPTSMGQRCFGVYLYWRRLRLVCGQKCCRYSAEIIPFYQAAQAHQDTINRSCCSPYMAGVSPWFFTHYSPQTFNKNWLYLSDTLLIDRWNEI
ncbi:hypothetical protein B0H13DRAFT_2523427 [Mycena leptocephala]|nr:hypothetical protein B0H13DRAFT_2523427 [Mycena leptocephala]